MNNNEIRRKIIEELYNIYEKNHLRNMPKGKLKDKIGVEYNELNRNVNYLKDKGYVTLIMGMGDYYAAKITADGIDLIESPEEFNTLFPQLNITQNIVHDSSNVVISSDNFINISDSFNQIYQNPEFLNSNHKEEIKKIIQELQIELQNEAVNKNKIQNYYNWLKINAN